MHVSVAIVGFRNADDILRCLSALEGSTHGDFDVIVCENGGAEALARLRAAAPSALAGGQVVRIVGAASNLGYAGGVNVCIAETPSAAAWWILNPDTLPDPGAMGEMVGQLTAEACHAVGCIVYLPGGKVQSYGGRWRRWLARAVSIGHGALVSAEFDADSVVRTQNYLNGSSMMVGRAFIEAAGLMREDYFLYCEEVEWCLRAQSAGMTLGLARRARVLHYSGTTTGSYDEPRRRPKLPVYLMFRNCMLLVRDCSPQALPVAAVALLFQLFLKYGRHGAWRQVGYGLSGWAAGLANERGAPKWVNTGAS